MGLLIRMAALREAFVRGSATIAIAEQLILVDRHVAQIVWPHKGCQLRIFLPQSKHIVRETYTWWQPSVLRRKQCAADARRDVRVAEAVQ